LSPFAVPGAEQPELLPAYAGPTPADPFGGQAFDIFDVMDQAERAAEAQPASRTTAAAEIVNDGGPEPITPDAAAVSDEPTAPAGELPGLITPELEHPKDAQSPAPEDAEPDAPMARQTEPEIINTGAPEPSGEARLTGAEPQAPTPANDIGSGDAVPEPPPEPLVKPIVIGADGDPPAERKRGWWRR
jgi:ribonuclease E